MTPISGPGGAIQGLLIVGHGSRQAGANHEFEALVEMYRQHRPDLHVGHGYIELAQPALIDALRAMAAQVREVLVVPLFLFAAGHVKNDIPLALAQARREFPRVVFRAAPALGVDPGLVQLAHERARPLIEAAREPERTALLVVGRGASDPDANADFYKVARLVSEGRGLGSVQPCFIGIARPRVEQALEAVARMRPERIVVLPYLLFGGRLIEKLQALVAEFRQQSPWIPIELAPPMGPDRRLLEVLDERVTDAGERGRPLACDSCQYRLPIAGVSQQVGGLQALLWSVRHGYTHNQAMPHVHAHRPMSKHVLVCGNVDCAARGSNGLITHLRRLLKDRGRDRDIRVTRTACMGRCGEGPTVAVYPDGIWYRGVTEADAGELVEQHLIGDRLVGRLVDNIMQ
jgi:sirohydrochlorin ferrochelatase/(2Fe-2S) ferredoxin